MGIQEKNRHFEETERKGLKALNRIFSAFRQTVLREVADASQSSTIRKICESMCLFALIFYEGRDGGVKEFLLGEDEEAESDVKMNYRQKIMKSNSNIKIEERNTKNIGNTGTEFSTGVISEVSITWVVSYKGGEEEYVHKIIANIVLDILVRKIKNLQQIQNNGDAFKACICEKNFIEYYIEAVERCFAVIPDVKVITEVSLHNYEKRESCGIVCFLEDDSFIKDEMVCFDEACIFQKGFYERDNVQGIRKLLELCRNGNLLIVSDSGRKGEIKGILCRNKIWEDEKVVSVHFKGTQWKLYCGKELILSYRNGCYYVDEKNEQYKLEETCKNSEVSYEIFGGLFHMLEEKAQYGALIIIAEDAKEEVDRLCVEYGRGIKLEDLKRENKVEKRICLSRKTKDELETLLSMANLDGAIFFDYDGNCHGFSIILDGIAKVPGEKKRGARYNSALNYIANAEGKKRCAVIRSEDKEKGLEIISNKQIAFSQAASKNLHV